MKSLEEFFKMVANGNMEVIKPFVEQLDIKTKSSFLNARSPFNLLRFTPLHEAAGAGHLAVVKYLIENGAFLEAKDDLGETPLFWAAEYGQLAVVEWIGENYSEALKARNNSRDTVLHPAAKNGHLEVVKYLVAKGIPSDEKGVDTPLFLATRYGHIPVAEYLLEKGASRNYRDAFGHTLLLTAAEIGCFEAIQWLLKNKISSLTEKNKWGETVLLRTVRVNSGRIDIAKWLLDNGASLTEVDSRNRTALLIAATDNPHSNMLPFLIQEGAAIGQSLQQDLPTENNLMSGMVVIGLKIKGNKVTRQTPGYEYAITSVPELVAERESITNHWSLIKACSQYLANNPSNEEIILLREKLILLADNSLKYICLSFIANDKLLKNELLKMQLLFPQFANTFVDTMEKLAVKPHLVSAKLAPELSALPKSEALIIKKEGVNSSSDISFFSHKNKKKEIKGTNVQEGKMQQKPTKEKKCNIM